MPDKVIQGVLRGKPEMCQEAILKVSVMGELINEEWIREDCQFKMGLEVREDHLVKDAC